MATLVTAVSITAIRRTYPHVAQIVDWQTQQSIRLLWDRVWGFEERLRALEATMAIVVAGLNTLNTNLAGVQETARQAYALAQTPATSPTPPGSTPGSCPDDGEADAGVSASWHNGLYTGDQGVVPTDGFHAGLIIGGTANEYPHLLDPTGTAGAREANMEELLLRMIWHLNQGGFVAGRQRNPSSVISKDKLTVTLGGEVFAYDCFQGVDFTDSLPVHANRVCPADYVVEAGTAD